MNDLRITGEEVDLLRDLMKYESVSVIWDLNAFYINSEKTTYKLECFDDLPEGSDSQFDEIVYCRFAKLSEKIEFCNPDPGFWYKILVEATRVEEVQIVDITQVFPQGILVDPDKISNFENGSNRVSLGCLFKVTEGFLPAFVLPSNYGFSWHEKYTFYSEEEAIFLLEKEIGKFELRAA